MPMRILVVEDEQNVAAFIEQGLTEEGYAVDAVGDGELALAYAETYDYDLILLDVLLPKMDGRQVARTLRQRGVQAPILMLTALDAVDDRVAGLDSGADDYLVKPFAYQELLARIRARTRNFERAGTNNELQVGDLTVNRLTRQVKRDGQEIELTAKEYALLEYLMLHPDHVLSRTQIGEHVWGYDFYNQSNIVDVYVGYLRRKIDAGHSKPLIRTVRGVGYKMTADA
ncbi:MAG: response regulator transcription factor [Caldilineaceae bacterium]|nr:response regulator transcription factor [Caldilineaceae bacterium]